MKNIYILPTDKPSRLHLWTDENGTRPALCELEYSHTRNTQNIYITSDEEIKEGDWCLVKNNPTLLVNLIRNDKGSIVGINDKSLYDFTDGNIDLYQGKIIITTDQDLIKDSVQAIDDEFLEWFVKNPSCEEVEVDKKENLWFCCDFFEEGQEKYCINSMPRCPKCNSALGGNHDWTEYKIIIPKEEPKQDRTCTNNCSVVCGECQIFKPKQETLKEVAERYVDSFEYSIAHPRRVAIKSFINGAKWQQEQIYNLIKQLYDNEEITGFTKRAYSQCLDIIEQFKNK